MINVENVEELNLINQIAGKLGKKQQIAIRVNPDIDPKTHPKISTWLKTSKFWIDIKEAIEVYKYAQTLNNIKVVGIHSHIWSQLLDLSPYDDLTKKLKELYLTLKSLGINIKYLDIWGGVGIKYKPDDKAPSISKLSEIVYNNLKDIKDQITLILEPGRSIVWNAGILLTKVQFVKIKDNKNFAIVDAGFNTLARPAMYGSYHHIVPLKLNENKKVYDIVWPICETGDILWENRALPELKRGDVLVILSAGAYGSSMASNYNLRGLPKEVIVDNWKFYL